RSRDRYAECLSDAESALRIDPGNLDALGFRAICLLSLGRVDEGEAALAALREAAKDAELSPDTAARYCTMEAVFFAEKGDSEEADHRMDACLEEAPTSGVLIEEALSFYDRQRKPERGIEVLRRALAAAPADGSFRRQLAERLRRSGEADEGEKILREG